MFDKKLHIERRRPQNHLRRIAIEADRQLEEESIARWLTLGDEVLDNASARPPVELLRWKRAS
jgi:hypothetical protein